MSLPALILYVDLIYSFLNGKPVKSSDYDALVELSTIASLCNDSSVDYNEVSSACHQSEPSILFSCTFRPVHDVKFSLFVKNLNNCETDLICQQLCSCCPSLTGYEF